MRPSEDVKKGLECCNDVNGLDCNVCPYVEVNYTLGRYCKTTRNADCLALIQQLEAEVKDTKANHQHTIDIAERQKNQIGKLKAACVKLGQTKAPRWISVEERLPEDVGAYVVYGNGRIAFATFYPSVQRWVSNVDSRITYWMPLPEPPKE